MPFSQRRLALFRSLVAPHNNYLHKNKPMIMLKSYSLALTVMAVFAICLTRCSDDKKAEPSVASTETPAEPTKFGGYESQAKWGEHLVTLGGCNDCHTPKKMTPQGPADDSTLFLSGHPESLPAPEVDRKAMESKGMVVTSDFTSWIGPWGITYSANLTPDDSGTGKWTEDQLLYALKTMTSKGLAGNRHLLPPMSMMSGKYMTDDELKAIYAFLRTVKPIKNNSVQPTQPALAPKK